MTDRIALIIAAVILGLIVLDILANDAAAATFLLRKLADLVEFLVFWR